jgi:hypothetical protein
MDLPELIWRKSSRSQGGGQNCVESTAFGGVILIRDSKNPGAEIHKVGSSEWHVFLGHIKSGHYDLPTAAQKS